MVKKIYAVAVLRCVLTFVFARPSADFPDSTEVEVTAEKTEVTKIKTGYESSADGDSYEIIHTIQCKCGKESMIVQGIVVAVVDRDKDGKPYIVQASQPSSFGGGGEYEWEEIIGFSDLPQQDKLFAHVTGQFVKSERVELNPVGALMPGMFFDASVQRKWYFRSDDAEIWINMTAEDIIENAK